MKKRIVLLCMLFVVAFCGFAQKGSLKLHKNSVFIELGGISDSLFSLNYDRTFYFNNNFGLIAGIGFSPVSFDFYYSPRFPVQAKFFYQVKNHTFEAGTGLTPYIWYTNSRLFEKSSSGVSLIVLGHWL